ncbi:hypothetical protein [Egbenema bharatensis]|uniref:hypothetical protein n=1 Tax=Egbenema bharatensis TaxID=3463334 RepID=UPI003A8813AE
MMPPSKYYFGDLVRVPGGEVGEVVGIWYRCDVWLYRLSGLSRMGAAWWNEGQLLRLSDD